MLTSSKVSGQVSDHSVVEYLKVVSLVTECLVAIVICISNGVFLYQGRLQDCHCQLLATQGRGEKGGWNQTHYSNALSLPDSVYKLNIFHRGKLCVYFLSIYCWYG